MKAFVFSLEALLALLAAVTLVAIASTQYGETGLNAVYRNALAQDALETSVKEKGFARQLCAFAAGDANAKTLVENDFAELFSGTGVECFKLKAGNALIETSCPTAAKNRFAAVATRALYDGTRFTEAELTLYFNA